VHIHDTIKEIQDKEVVTEAEFNDEVQMQVDIFKESIDVFFEPICPNVIMSSIRNQTEIAEFMSIDYGPGKTIQQIVDEATQFIEEKREKREADQMFLEDPFNEINAEEDSENTEATLSDMRFGIIIMEIVEDFKVASSYFPTLGVDGHDYVYFLGKRKSNTAEQISVRNRILVNYAFQLVKLMILYGYRHGDPHLANALVFENYDYIENYRVVLIDFGRCQKVTPDYSLNTLITPDGHWLYSIIRGFFQYHKIYGESNCRNFYNDCQNKYIVPSRLRYIERLYESKTFSYLMMMENYMFYSLHEGKLHKTDFYEKDEYSLITMLVKPHESLLGKNYKVGLSSECPNTRILREDYVLTKSIEYARQLVSDPIYSDTLRDLTPSPDTKIYTYIIGVQDGPPPRFCKIFVARVFNCIEYGTKHLALMNHFDIAKYYGVGELRVKDTNITLNIASGTFMGDIVDDETPEEVFRRSEMCRRVLMNHMFGTPFTITLAASKEHVLANKMILGDTFFTVELCCDLDTRLAEESRMLEFDESLGEFDESYGGGILTQTMPTVMPQMKMFPEIDYKIPEIVRIPDTPQDSRFLKDWKWGIENGIVIKPAKENEKIEEFQHLLNTEKFNTPECNFDIFMKTIDLLYYYINTIKYGNPEKSGGKRVKTRKKARISKRRRKSSFKRRKYSRRKI